MKVLEINSVCGIRSTGRICTDLADVLSSMGHECRVAYGRETVPEKYQEIAVRVGSDLSVKADAFFARIFDNAGFNSARATRKFIKWVESYDPDVIHLHNLHGYYINIKLLFDYLKKAGKPVIWTLHDCWTFTGHCVHFTRIGCDKWKKQCYRCPKKKVYPASYFLDRSKKNYQKKKALFTSLENLTLVTPSTWLASKVRESFLGKYPVHAIPNGVNLDVFQPTFGDFRKKHGLENKKIILGAATAWSKSKGLELFAKLSKMLGEEYQVVLVGITPEAAKTLPDSVLALPRTNSIQEMAEIYTAADVFLNLGQEETMGLTTVEAMACGTPVVTSNLTAVPEVVADCGGIVLEDLEVETVMQGIEKVLSKTYENTRQNAENYEKWQQYEKYIDLYTEIVSK